MYEGKVSKCHNAKITPARLRDLVVPICSQCKRIQFNKGMPAWETNDLEDDELMGVEEELVALSPWEIFWKWLKRILRK